MGDWADSIKNYTPAEQTLITERFPACGTTGCIAGWITILSKPKKDKKGFYILPKVDFEKFGAKVLGLHPIPRTDWNDPESVAKYDEHSRGKYDGPAYADNLFFVEQWPKKFNIAYYKAKTPAQYAKVTAERLQYFLETAK